MLTPTITVSTERPLAMMLRSQPNSSVMGLPRMLNRTLTVLVPNSSVRKPVATYHQRFRCRVGACNPVVPTVLMEAPVDCFRWLAAMPPAGPAGSGPRHTCHHMDWPM